MVYRCGHFFCVKLPVSSFLDLDRMSGSVVKPPASEKIEGMLWPKARTGQIAESVPFLATQGDWQLTVG